MFQRLKKVFYVLFICGISGLLAASCDIHKASDALSNVNLVIGLQPITTTVSGAFTDAKTGDLINNVTLSFMGNGAGDVIDMFSDPISQQTFKGGFASFGIDNNVAPSSSNPLSFTIVAKASGYQTTYKKVILKDTTHFSFNMSMVNTKNPPSGTSSGSNTTATTTSSGAVTQSYSVQTQTNANASSTASMSVPDSTVMTDANGDPLSGSLTTNMTYFADSASAISQMPGGFSEGQITAGFTEITITDANNKKAAHFSKPVTVTFEVSSNMINPVTGTKYQSGDSMLVRSYDENSGQWKDEGMAVLTGPNSNGNFDATYKISHLSYYSIGVNGIKTTTNGATIKINRNGHTGQLHCFAYGYAGDASGTTPKSAYYVDEVNIPAGTNQITLPVSGDKVPEVNGWFLVDGFPNYSWFGYYWQYVSNLGSGTYTINLPAAPSNSIDVTFNVQPICSDPAKKLHVKNLSTAVLSYKSDSNNKAQWTQVPLSDKNWQFDNATQALTGATVTVNGLINGQSYTFKLSFDGKTYSKDVTISGKKMTISQTISGSYCK